MTRYAELTSPTTLEITRDLPGPIEKVWDYLTKDEHRRKWLCGGNIEARVGGTVEYDFDHSRLSTSAIPDDHPCAKPLKATGEVLEYDRPHRMKFTWPSEPGTVPTVVTMLLSPIEDGVRLRIIHEKLDQDSFKIGASAGWHAHLDVLEDLLTGQPKRDFWQHISAMDVEYEARHAAHTSAS